MVPSKSSLVTICALLLALHGTAVLAANVATSIYKYKDKDGNTVYNASIPAEYVKNGYTVLNERGQVVQVVPRAPTAEEIASQQAAKAAEQKAVTNKIAQDEADKLLIRLYRTPEEITRKRDLALVQLKTQEDLVKLNITKADQEIVRLQGIIENNAKAGHEPPADIKKKMEQKRTDKEKLEAQIKSIGTERDKLNADTDRDVKRLTELLSPPAAAAGAAAKPASAEKPAAQ